MSDEAIAINEVLERVQDDRELLLELLDIFQEDYVEKRKNITAAIENKNFTELKNIAHSLKGASSNISAKNVHLLFSDLEQIAPEGNVDTINDIMKNIDEQYTTLSTHIEKIKKEYSGS